MLQLRPNCEHCNCNLAPQASNAMICSYECTFCRDCVNKLDNVCPNCGGGFVPRPIRTTQVYVENTSLQNHPAQSKRVQKTVDLEQHKIFAQNIKSIPPEQR